jgi:hypothetical protein
MAERNDPIIDELCVPLVTVEERLLLLVTKVLKF